MKSWKSWIQQPHSRSNSVASQMLDYRVGCFVGPTRPTSNPTIRQPHSRSNVGSNIGCWNTYKLDEKLDRDWPALLGFDFDYAINSVRYENELSCR